MTCFPFPIEISLLFEIEFIDSDGVILHETGRKRVTINVCDTPREATTVSAAGKDVLDRVQHMSEEQSRFPSYLDEEGA